MDEATKVKQPDTMRELLRKWAELEPSRCAFETTPNLIQGEPNDEKAYVADAEKNMRVVFDDVIGVPLDEDSLMRIQWAVQQAIIEREWYLCFEYLPRPKKFIVDVDNLKAIADNQVEALLSAYLKALEANQ